jgi:orotidine 5'-phosphate decarboxylase subfamily 2
MGAFRGRIETLNDERGHLCVGVDPRPGRFPPDDQDAEGLERWCLNLVEATEEQAAAYKPNLAFFLAMGPEGLRVLEAVADRAEAAGALTILDGKFTDIGSTAEAYARFADDVVGADAVTLSPYMGTDVLDPFLDRDLDAFVLARTTNASASQVQDTVAGEVVQTFSMRGTGFVAPGNDPDTAGHVRQTAGGAPLLLPGIGAQGGSAAEAARTARGGPFLIAIGRGIAHAEGSFPDNAREAAQRFSKEIDAALDG